MTNRLGGIDLLVNAAGISAAKRFESAADSAMSEEVAVNLVGSVRMTREALPFLRQWDEGGGVFFPRPWLSALRLVDQDYIMREVRRGDLVSPREDSTPERKEEPAGKGGRSKRQEKTSSDRRKEECAECRHGHAKESAAAKFFESQL